jgi:hypothetical protein
MMHGIGAVPPPGQAVPAGHGVVLLGQTGPQKTPAAQAVQRTAPAAAK